MRNHFCQLIHISTSTFTACSKVIAEPVTDELLDVMQERANTRKQAAALAASKSSVAANVKGVKEESHAVQQPKGRKSCLQATPAAASAMTSSGIKAVPAVGVPARPTRKRTAADALVPSAVAAQHSMPVTALRANDTSTSEGTERTEVEKLTVKKGSKPTPTASTPHKRDEPIMKAARHSIATPQQHPVQQAPTATGVSVTIMEQTVNYQEDGKETRSRST